MVEIVWDRERERTYGALLAETPSGTILAPVPEPRIAPGFFWISAEEIGSSRRLEPDDARVRLAALTGSRPRPVPDDLTDLRTLLRHLDGCLAFLYRASTGCGIGWVGRVRRVTDESATFEELDTRGNAYEEPMELELEEIIAIEWDTEYLTDLARVAELNG